MDLWLLTAGLFFLGWVLVALSERSRQVQPVARTLAETAVVYLTYISVVGLLVAFNLFALGRIDPFFTSTGWHAFRILYWPVWVLNFSPLLICGVLVVVAVGVRRPRRIVGLALLLLVTLATLEVVFLLEVTVLGTVLVQAAAFVLFAVGVFVSSRSSQVKGPRT